MPGSADVVPPVLFTSRDEVADAVKAELKGLGVNQCKTPTEVEGCLELLFAEAHAMLVIDWAVGPEVVNQVLEAVRGHFKVETRPIFLIIPDLDPNHVAAGVEYGVSQIHSGPISRQSIRESLQALLDEEKETASVREVLVQVATFRDKNEWTMATPLLRELLAKDPSQTRIICELAENLIHENAWHEALNLLTPLVRAEPPHVRALHLAGRCYLQQGDFDSAIGLLGKAKLINPYNVARLVDLGDSYLKSNQLGEALTNFKEALALDDQNQRAASGAGAAMLLAGDINEALALMKTMSGPREMASIFNTAAVLAIRQNNFTQGMQLYQNALKSIGHDDHIAARLLFNMGMGFRRWGKPKKAMLCFDKSHALDPTFDKAVRQKEALAGPAPAALGDHMFEVQEFTLAARDTPSKKAS